MLTAMLLSILLMLEGLQGGATAAFDFQHNGKSMYSHNILMSSDGGRQNVRKQPRHQTKNEIHRSLDLDAVLNMLVTPSPKRGSLPIITKLFPPTAKPVHQHANMPMRFGRQSDASEDASLKSTPNMPMRFGRQNDLTEDNSAPNMPQRFGRSRKVIRMCDRCLSVRKPTSPLISGSDRPYWSIYRILALSHILNADFNWDGAFKFRRKK